MKKILFTLICLAINCCLTVLVAQDTTKRNTVDELFELSLDDFLNVVITPSKLPQFAGNVTQKVDLISSDEIATMVLGNRNICEAISKLPGASISVLSRNDANWGTYSGIGPKYSTYMLQGLPIDAFMDPISLDLNAINHIEVQRGPASVIYPNYLSQDFAGNQSPLAGTVNLILKDKIERKKTIVQTAYGTYNTLNEQVFHQNKKEQLHYFLGASFEMSDYTNYGTDNSWLNMHNNPEYSKTKVYGGLSLFVDKNEKQKLSLYCHKTWHNGNTGRVYKGYNYEYGTVNIGYNIEFNNKISVQTHVGIRTYDRSWQESNFGQIDTLKSKNGVAQLIIPADISLSWLHGKANILSIGADYQNAGYSTWSDPLVGYQIFGNKSRAMQSGIYIQEEWRPVQKLTLRGGLRFAYISNNIELVNAQAPTEDDLSWNHLLWSVGFKYQISKKLSVFFNSGTGFSTPGLKSTAGTIELGDKGIPGRNGQLPSPDLKPEMGIGADAGIDFLVLANLRLSIRGFYTMLQDGIIDNVVSLNPSQTQSINTESTSKGCEIEISHLISSNITWYANATYMISNIVNNLNNDQHNTEIPFSPNYVANIGVTYTSSFGFKMSPALNYNGGFYDGISKANRQWYTPGILLNTHVSQMLKKSDLFNLECFLNLYNITNNKYELPWQFQNPGFSGMLGLKVVF